VSTISDEALALLGLENGVDCWDDNFTKYKCNVRPFLKGQKPTKYTVSSNPNANTYKEGNGKRWSKEGIIRFNQPPQLIIKDPTTHPEFMPKWLAQECDSMKKQN
jgi:hypothetical protein